MGEQNWDKKTNVGFDKCTVPKSLELSCIQESDKARSSHLRFQEYKTMNLITKDISQHKYFLTLVFSPILAISGSTELTNWGK